MKDKFRFQSQFLLRFNIYVGNVVLSIQFVLQSIELFLSFLKYQRCALHAVVVLRHVLFDDQTLSPWQITCSWFREQCLRRWAVSKQADTRRRFSLGIGHLLERRSWIWAWTESPIWSIWSRTSSSRSSGISPRVPPSASSRSLTAPFTIMMTAA